KRLRVTEGYWASTVSDDYALTRAVREAGGRIRFEPRCLVKSREDSSLGEFLRWANRQIIITRVYSSRLWWKALGFYLFYGVTFLAGLGDLVFSPRLTAERLDTAGLLLAVLALGFADVRLRSHVAPQTFPEQ